jgi:hypothetical protein
MLHPGLFLNFEHPFFEQYGRVWTFPWSGIRIHADHVGGLKGGIAKRWNHGLVSN